MPILPQRLRPGDRVGLIAPASAPADARSIDRAVAIVEAMGFEPRLARNARRRHGFLAGTDRERAGDLMQMFSDRAVRGIFCIRGGYGTSRLLSLLDFAAIRRHPKILAGFSDITSLHCALLKKSNLLTFHGPTAAADFLAKKDPNFSRQSLLRMIMEPEPFRSINQGYDGDTVSILRRGKASGQLIGGNLSLLCALMGTPYQPSFREKILFLEEVDEKPYRVDRMLTQLLNAGVLQQAEGIAVGVCERCEDPKAKNAREYRQTLDDVLRERLRPLKIPVVIGLPFGHGQHNATLPFGGWATLDADAGDLILTSAAVS